MIAAVQLRLPDGAEHSLGPGEIIGRLWSAGLCLSDPRVSEAHAMVSLRGGALRLLPLRGLCTVDGQPVRDAELAVGQRLGFAAGLELEVIGLHLPAAALAIEGPGLPRQLLPGTAALLRAPGGLRLAPGAPPDALAWVWTTGAAWLLQRPGGAAAEITPGHELEIGGQRVVFVEVALQAWAAEATLLRPLALPLRVVNWYDSVELHRPGLPPLRLGGVGARLISELIGIGGPAGWEVLAGLLWPGPADRQQQRRRWDVALTRLRARLRAAQIRDDLVSSDGVGNTTLLLHPGDEVEDHA